MIIKKFNDIESWIEARALVTDIYRLTSENKVAKDYGFKDQLQRGSVSIMSNIAEGFDSGSTKSFINYLNHAYASSSEVLSLLFIAKDIGYISEEDFVKLNERIEKVRKLIGGFIQYLKSTKTKNQELRTKN